MSKPVLVLFVGIPGSGKTAFARQLAERIDAVILNSDGIRMAMWHSLDEIQATHKDPAERKLNNQLTFGAMNYAADKILKAGHSVVYDCNANHLWERQENHDIARKNDAISVVVRLRVPYDVSLHRIQNREEAHDQRRISAEKAKAVLDRFTVEIEEPQSGESVIEISGEAPFVEQYAIFMQGLEGIRAKIQE